MAVSDEDAEVAKDFMETLGEGAGLREFDGYWYMSLQAMLERGWRVSKGLVDQGGSDKTVFERLFLALAPALFSGLEPDGTINTIAELRRLSEEEGWRFIPPPASDD